MSFDGDLEFLVFDSDPIIDSQTLGDATVTTDQTPTSPEQPAPQNDLQREVSEKLLRLYPQRKVGILGAGIGGLYIALMLDDLGIEYEILEASGRVGGRLRTYRFNNATSLDFCDMGAMRFPLPKKESGVYQQGVMKRLAELTEYAPLNSGEDNLRDKLKVWYYKGNPLGKSLEYFNGVRRLIADRPTNPPESFRATEMGVTRDYIRVGVNKIYSDVLNSAMELPDEEIKKYSVHAYMATTYRPKPDLGLPPTALPHEVINWIGLFKGGTGAFDRSLKGAVHARESFSGAKVEWKCFEGGSETLTNKMAQYIGPSRIRTLHRAVTINEEGTLIIQVPENFPPGNVPPEATETDEEPELIIDPNSPGTKYRIPCLAVTTKTDQPTRQTHKYLHVFSTLPLPILRTMNLNGAGLNIRQKNAIRKLSFAPGIKIAMLFRENWWYTKLGIKGGQSFTDLPIRTIVYPSNGPEHAKDSKVLIASYCWANDADRLGSLATHDQLEVLQELVLRNLAETHQGLHPDVNYGYLERNLEKMHVKDWSRDVYTMGAYAGFKPGDFRDVSDALHKPAAGKRFYFAGEVVSKRHGWAVGALQSSWTAVVDYLENTGQGGKINDEFKRKWGSNAEWKP